MRDISPFRGGFSLHFLTDPAKTGGCSTDGAAKRLAEALGEKVKAPTEDIHVEENGEIFISDNDTLAEMWYTDVEHRSEYKSTGAWRTFDP